MLDWDYKQIFRILQSWAPGVYLYIRTNGISVLTSVSTESLKTKLWRKIYAQFEHYLTDANILVIIFWLINWMNKLDENGEESLARVEWIPNVIHIFYFERKLWCLRIRLWLLFTPLKFWDVWNVLPDCSHRWIRHGGKENPDVWSANWTIFP